MCGGFLWKNLLGLYFNKKDKRNNGYSTEYEPFITALYMHQNGAHTICGRLLYIYIYIMLIHFQKSPHANDLFHSIDQRSRQKLHYTNGILM